MKFSISAKKDKVYQQIQDYMEELQEFSHLDLKVPIIGHRMGDHKHYPVNVNKDSLLITYKPVCNMMDEAFLEKGLTGIELDVRLWKKENISVVHDAIEPTISNIGEKYLSNNSIENIIKHFIDQKYYKDRKLFIELKINMKFFDFRSFSFFPDMLSELEKISIHKTMEKIEATIASYEEKERIAESICIISFNISALHYAFYCSHYPFPFYLIISTNQFLKKFLSRFFSYIPLTDKEKQRIQYSEWIRGIWFDPNFLSSPVQTLTDINAKRKNKLEFFLSTYGMQPEKLFKKLKSCKTKIAISGLIFECEP